MLLLIDAGNTRIKWALADDGAGLGAWAASGELVHAELAQLPATLQLALSGRTVSRALISNVAGDASGLSLRAALGHVLQQGPGQARPATEISWFASLPQLAGVKNGYRNPAQLGCDRFAAAIGARAGQPGRALIVATCGTATTIDAITPDGAFIGGMILPGLGLMASSLARNTAQLPQVGSDAAIRAGFADNTDDAIIQGCLAAQAGAIERACAAHPSAHATDAVLCMLSGGAARFIAPHLAVPHQMTANIVLIGLQAAANSKEHPC
jgi:type III pantothenate kinase